MDIELLKNEVKYLLEEGEGCHDWDHTLRVFNMAIHIGEIEGANLEVLKLAALLHDIARPIEGKMRKEGKKICHAEVGSVMAEEILRQYGIDEEKINKIKNCILKHRFSRGHEPKTKEEKILYDADKLDNIGAIGILRAANYSGTYNAKTHNPNVPFEDVLPHSKEDTAYQHYQIKLKKVKNKLFTDEAKRIAEERDKFMKEFFERANEECRGKK